MTEEYDLTHERVDDIPLLIGLAQRLRLPEIMDKHMGNHGHHQGLSNGWLATVWLAYILSEGDHRKYSVEDWAEKHKHTLEELVDQPITAANQDLRFTGVSVGNPHCVILSERTSPELARRYGPLIEIESRFPRRTNVQFLEIIDRRNIRIEIWERGAGYTLASGSSSCAAAGVAHRLGLCGPRVTVEMPGGELAIGIEADGLVRMRGPALRIARGELSLDFLEAGPA